MSVVPELVVAEARAHGATARRAARSPSGRACARAARGARRTRANRAASRGSPVVRANECGGGRGIRCVDEDAARRVGRIGRVGRVPASAQVDAQAEVVDDPAGEQAHEVRVARQARVDAGPRAAPTRPRRRRGRAARARRPSSPARARYAAATRALWPPPTITTSWVCGAAVAPRYRHANADRAADAAAIAWRHAARPGSRSPRRSRSRGRRASSPGGAAPRASRSPRPSPRSPTSSPRPTARSRRSSARGSPRQRPGDGFLGEESGAERGTTDITWVVDPIDGTVNYAYGIPAYAVSIAAVAGEPEPGPWEALAGVVFNPATGELFHAARGSGRVARRTRGSRSTPSRRAAGALLATGFGYDPATHAGDLARVARVMPLARDLRRIGAASLDLAFVAAGRLDGYFERGLQPWDHAAGALLVDRGGRHGRRRAGRRARPRADRGGRARACSTALLAAAGWARERIRRREPDRRYVAGSAYMAFPGAAG